MLEALDLGFEYKNGTGLKKLSFKSPLGSITTLYGHNGSGKSTLLKILCGLLPAKASGDLRFSSTSVLDAQHFLNLKIRRHLGVLFQGPSSDEKLSLLQNLIFAGAAFGLSISLAEARAWWALKHAHLEERAYDLVKTLSGGMRRRLELYRSFMHEPLILVLDEPCAGLDKAEKIYFFNFIKNYQQSTNALVVMSTHDDEECAHCDQLLMLKNGELIKRDSPATMLKEHDYVYASFDRDEGTARRQKISVSELSAFLSSNAISEGQFKSLALTKPTLADLYDELCEAKHEIAPNV